jgi:phospholipid transport system substrate-binding protein
MFAGAQKRQSPARRLGRMRTFLAAFLGLWLSAAAAQLLAPPPARPDTLMSALTSDVMGTLSQDRAAGRATDLARLVDERIVPVFDFSRMTSIALARNWRLASAEQQAALVAQFKTLLVRTYSQALVDFRDQAIDYKPLRAAAGDSEVTVRSALRRPGVEPLTIDYEMADGVTGWKVYDVKLAGVSLVLAYRESFATIVRASGIDGLIKALADKNRQNGGGMSAIDGAKLAPVLMLYGASRSAQP